MCVPEFLLVFRAILYNTRITWGAKCLALAIIDSPGSSVPSNAILARKLKSSPAQVSLWRKELKRNKMDFSREKNSYPNTAFSD